MSEFSDSQLVSQYLKGDKKALEVLIARYLKPVYGFIYTLTGETSEAEDLTQEVFIKMWKHLKSFKPDHNFKTWLFTIAKNTAIDYLRKKKAIPFSQFENEEGENLLMETLADNSPLPDKIFEQADLANLLNTAIDKLPARYKQILFLYFNEHFTFQEIAEIMNESINTVKSRQRRALISLKKLLTEQ